ncbi:hypothetical protein [Thalassobacillus sp. CUG 92003]|uniref:hypothetical protein n=1 Tax=Thalassobacillus sp. CUG 92003 TaxID=2736641 RepID=UPI0015E6DC61|nr:hypothetical protein [Thalassobacillus sp. CUG 92003]
MKIYVAVALFLVLLTFGYWFYEDNRQINQLKAGEVLPIDAKTTVRESQLVHLTHGEHQVEQTGISIGDVYGTQEAMYFGIWYNRWNAFHQEDKQWDRTDHVVNYYVTAKDEQGNLYQGETLSYSKGTFEIFQYVKLQGVHDIASIEELEFIFYPKKSTETARELKPSATPLFSTGVKIR